MSRSISLCAFCSDNFVVDSSDKITFLAPKENRLYTITRLIFYFSDVPFSSLARLVDYDEFLSTNNIDPLSLWQKLIDW